MHLFDRASRRILALPEQIKSRQHLTMRRETEERWRKLCEQAVTEQDPTELMKLISEINQLVES